MNRKRYLFFTAALACTVLLGLCSACSEYQPAENENYFRLGDVYRVFTLQSETPETIEELPLRSLMPVMAEIATNYTIRYFDAFSKGSLFFDSKDSEKLNCAGVAAVYDSLGISGYELQDERYDCDFTGLHTYNRLQKLGESSFTVRLDDKPKFTVYGDVASVQKYTFAYTDKAEKDGAEKGSGTFSVYICDIPYISTFVAYS